MQLHFQYDMSKILIKMQIQNCIKALKMGSVEFCMTICMLSFDSMVYLNQFYDLEKALDKDKRIQNPETLAVYIFESEKKSKICSLFILLSIVRHGKEITQSVPKGRQMLNNN